MRVRMTKVTAMATAAAIVCSMFVSPVGTVAYAKSVTTGTESKNNVSGLKVPTLAYDDNSITIVWDKPEDYANVADYNIYINGVKTGTARGSYKRNAEWASAYMDAFYDGYEKKNIDMVNVDIHSYKATGLTPSTEYAFEVRPVDRSGNELGTSNIIKQSTTASGEIFNIVDYGAKTSEGYTHYDDQINQLIESNTKAIQAAIDACTEGGKVVIPEGTFVSGAVYLKSNMTLELQKGAVLWGSPNTDHYDHNYLLYPYSTDTRAWALVNAYSSDENKMYENIRITGQGTIYGNGWKYGKKDVPFGDGVSDIQYQTKNELDPASDDYKLEQWMQGKSTNAIKQGILAKDAFEKATKDGKGESQAYATRPNLVALRGVDGIFIEGITVKNPAFHTIALLDSKNVVSTDVKYITYDCNNADGIEIGNTKNATIFNNFFDTGDDSINFATGLGNGVQDSGQQPSDDIWTFNNFIRNGHGGAIAAGSHTGAGISNMLVEDNVINLNEMPFRFKSAPVNGGGIFNVIIRDCAVANCKQLFVMTTSYGDANQAFQVEPADKPAEFYNVSAYNITADTISKNSFQLLADVKDLYKPWHTHHDLQFKDITCTNITVANSEEVTGCENVEFNNVLLNWNVKKVATPTPWAKIGYSKNIKFTGTTTTSSVARDAMEAPTWPADLVVKADSKVEAHAEYSTADVNLSWDAASDNKAVDSYSIDVKVGDKKVDQVDGIKDVKKTINGLSTGTDYTFGIYACDATGNRTLGKEVTVKTDGEKDQTPIVAPKNTKVTFDESGIGYTWALAKFEKASAADERVRGYKVYVNGTYTETFYNYKIKDLAANEYISQNVRRLTAGKENEVKIVAFTDAGIELSYDVEMVKTTENYDHLAPVWNKDAKVNIQKSENDIILSWPAATDESGICGYRVYVDGTPVLGEDGEVFNQVNGKFTTTQTTYTVKGLDLTKAHTFKVEAGDNWWKAVKGDGPYHWTLSGPSGSYELSVTKPNTPGPSTTPEPTNPVVSATPKPTVSPTVKPTVKPTTKPTNRPVTVEAVKNVKAVAQNTSTINVSWSKQDVTGYVITYKDVKGKMVTKKLTSPNTTSYKVTGLAPNKSYTFTVKAYKMDGKKEVYGKAVSVTAKTKALQKVTGLKAGNVKNDSMTLKWNKVPEASGYVITYKNALGKNTKVVIKNGSKTTASISNLLSNKFYKFTVKPYRVVNGMNVYGSEVTTKVSTKKTVKPGKVSLKSVKKSSKTSAKVTYKSVKNAAGYEIAYSLKKNSGFKKVTHKNASTVTVSKLKAKRTYYVKVRAYTYENRVVKGKVVKVKVYGAYSTVKKVSLR